MPPLLSWANHMKQLGQILTLAVLYSSITFADGGKLIPLEDLRLVSMAARAHQIPILLLVSQYHCSYCDRMKEAVLQPLQLNQAYRQRVLIRELSIDPGERVITLAGKSQAAADFISGYSVSVTPTLLFLDAQGREAAQRIIGINTVDFLFYYIDDAIQQATTRIQAFQ